MTAPASDPRRDPDAGADAGAGAASPDAGASPASAGAGPAPAVSRPLAPAPARGRRPGAKWVALGCGGVFTILALGGLAVFAVVTWRAVVTDPLRVEDAARALLPIAIPRGAEGQLALDFGDVRMVFLGDLHRERPLLVVLAGSPEAKAEETRARVADRLRRSGRYEVADAPPREVVFRFRGRPVEARARLAEGDGAPLVHYEMTILHEGRVVALYAIGAPDLLDDARVQAMLEGP